MKQINLETITALKNMAVVLCYDIEQLPASESQTELSVRASAIHASLQNIETELSEQPDLETLAAAELARIGVEIVESEPQPVKIFIDERPYMFRGKNISLAEVY